MINNNATYNAISRLTICFFKYFLLKPIGWFLNGIQLGSWAPLLTLRLAQTKSNESTNVMKFSCGRLGYLSKMSISARAAEFV